MKSILYIIFSNDNISKKKHLFNTLLKVQKIENGDNIN